MVVITDNVHPETVEKVREALREDDRVELIGQRSENTKTFKYTSNKNQFDEDLGMTDFPSNPPHKEIDLEGIEITLIRKQDLGYGSLEYKLAAEPEVTE